MKRLLEKDTAWKGFVDSKSKSSKKYVSALDAMLEELATRESGFEADAIAEALRVQDRTPAGVERAKDQVGKAIEERIDEEVLSGGHSGEQHYAKGDAFQEARMEGEGRPRVTTLDDSARTKKFMTHVKLTVRENLLSAVFDLVDGVTEPEPVAGVSRASVRAVTGPLVNSVHEFSQYAITLETIAVRGAGAGAVTIRVVPKLESNDEFPKTVYTRGVGKDETDETIVMYWGRNSPTVTLTNGDGYDDLHDAFKDAIKAPVTAF